jgi:hypothetical protein
MHSDFPNYLEIVFLISCKVKLAALLQKTYGASRCSFSEFANFETGQSMKSLSRISRICSQPFAPGAFPG